MRRVRRALMALVVAAAPVPPADHQLTLRRELAKRDARVRVDAVSYEIGRARIGRVVRSR
jgi:hypothetical protein